MLLLDVLHQDRENIAQAGIKAIKKALEAGVPVYYIDAGLGEGIIKEMPDGSRYLIEVHDGDEVVLQTFAPR